MEWLNLSNVGPLWEAFYVLYCNLLRCSSITWNIFSYMLLSVFINAFKATMYLLTVSFTVFGTFPIRAPPTTELMLKDKWPVTRPRSRSNRIQTKLSAAQLSVLPRKTYKRLFYLRDEQRKEKCTAFMIHTAKTRSNMFQPSHSMGGKAESPVLPQRLTAQ